MADEQNFANMPVSLAEVRSDRSQSARDWSPRDALIAALRDLDSGKIKPEAMVIVYREEGSDAHSKCARFYAASPDPHITLGMMRAIEGQMVMRS